MRQKELRKPFTSLSSRTSKCSNRCNRLLTIKEAWVRSVPALSPCRIIQSLQLPLSSSSNFMDTTSLQSLGPRGAFNNTRKDKRKSSLLLVLMRTIFSTSKARIFMSSQTKLKCLQRWKAMINTTCNISTIRAQEIWSLRVREPTQRMMATTVSGAPVGSPNLNTSQQMRDLTCGLHLSSTWHPSKFTSKTTTTWGNTKGKRNSWRRN